MLPDWSLADKRSLVFESEFASPVRMTAREENILSVVIRQAWDTGVLRTLTKNSPAITTGGHISIGGHVTRDELRRTDLPSGSCGFALLARLSGTSTISLRFS